ncbi:hypothetical protein [Mycobacterium sp. UM_Kg27]|uniref:hypothetical protein n=1 Tax=Mycobacterium sp. UM_Kg27 TaxID=1545693 RepID=UPI00061B1D2B|nr:hypothetical protein [Mycobacterium sp. UM_Kg27]
MQHLILRPHLTAGIAVVGAGLLAVVPVEPVTAPALSSAETPAVALTTTYTELFTNTWDNVQNISAHADWSGIFQVFTAMFTNPLGVIGAFTDLTPTVDTDITALPATVSVQLAPAMELLIANLGSQAATLNALNSVIADLGDPATGFTALLNAPATVLNAYLNGQDNLSLLGGIITIPVFNGILAPEQNMAADLNLTKLLDALGLGNLDLTNVNLAALIDQLGLGDLTLGGLLTELGISGDGLGDLLKLGSNITDLGGLLSFLGLGDLGLGSFSLTGILSGLGLDTDVDLNSLSLDDVLNAFGINTEINLGLAQLLTDLGFGGLVDSSLGSLLAGLPTGALTDITNFLNSVLASIINGLPLVGTVLDEVLGSVVLTPQNLIDALNTVTFGDLLGGQSIDETVSSLLAALGVTLPTGDLTIGGILEGLGFADSTGELTLGGLLSGLGGGLLGLDVTGLLNGLDLGGLISGLGLDNLPLNLGDLVGDLSNLNLGELLDDLGLGNLDLASISVGAFGGMITEMLVTVPQQILDALSG